MAVIDEVKKIVSERMEKDPWDFHNHIERVAKYSLLLADKLNADKEILEISAWLHDIHKIGERKPKHHVSGSIETEKILLSLNYPLDKINQIKHCVLTHSTDKNYPPETLEAKILASADAIASFDDFVRYCYAYFGINQLSYTEGKKRLVSRVNASWEKIMPKARNLAQGKYDAIMLILKA